MRFRSVVSASLISAAPFEASGVAQRPQHLFCRVTAGPEITAPVSGRLLVFLSAGQGAKEVNINEFHPQATYVAAKEIHDLNPGDYQAQAVLDVGHTFAYSGRTAGDYASGVVELAGWTPGEGKEPEFALTSEVGERPLSPAMAKMQTPAAQAAAHLEQMQSAALTRFWGRPVYVRAWVMTPPGYEAKAKKRYPTVYW